MLSHVDRAGTGPIDYVHLLTSDHPAVPVVVEEIRATVLCDFCCGEEGQWLLPVEN